MYILRTPLRCPEHAEDTRPCLPDGRLDLVGRQREAIRALVTEFIGVGVGGVSSDISVVSRRTGGGVQGRAAGADCVSSSRDGADSRCSIGGQCAVCSIVLGASTAVVTVGPEKTLAHILSDETMLNSLPEDVLSVRVNIEVQANALRVLERLNLGGKPTILRCISGCLALVSFRARVGASSAGKLPLVRPVAIDVSANAAVSADGLAVLAPETIRCLGVDKTIWVDNGHDVEIKLVDNSLDVGIRSVLGEQLPGEVLCCHGGDPFACVDGTVDEHCRLRSLAPRSPDVDASNDASLNRGAGGDDLRVASEAALEIAQERQVVRVWVVCCEPAFTGDWRRKSAYCACAQTGSNLPAYTPISPSSARIAPTSSLMTLLSASEVIASTLSGETTTSSWADFPGLRT